LDGFREPHQADALEKMLGDIGRPLEAVFC